MKIIETVWAYGHKNIISTHKTTFEITKETTLTRRGDCIIAVKATRGAADICPKFKEAVKNKNAQLMIIIEANDVKEIVKAHGSSRLTFTSLTDIVIRKSNYICGRTVAIGADKAACDLSRNLVKKLKVPYQKVKIMLIVKDY